TPDPAPTRSEGRPRIDTAEFAAQHIALAAPMSTSGTSSHATGTRNAIIPANSSIAATIDAKPVVDTTPGAVRSVSRPTIGASTRETTAVGIIISPATSADKPSAVCR